jgi:hypothetical protein
MLAAVLMSAHYLFKHIAIRRPMFLAGPVSTIPPGAILTEACDPILTEGCDYLVIEDS